jgi:hypothetical protein
MPKLHVDQSGQNDAHDYKSQESLFIHEYENSAKREDSAPQPRQREAGDGNFKVNDYARRVNVERECGADASPANG